MALTLWTRHRLLLLAHAAALSAALQPSPSHRLGSVVARRAPAPAALDAFSDASLLDTIKQGIGAATPFVEQGVRATEQGVRSTVLGIAAAPPGDHLVPLGLRDVLLYDSNRAVWSEGARVAPERPRAGRWVEGGHHAIGQAARGRSRELDV